MRENKKSSNCSTLNRHRNLPKLLQSSQLGSWTNTPARTCGRGAFLLGRVRSGRFLSATNVPHQNRSI